MVEETAGATTFRPGDDMEALGVWGYNWVMDQAKDFDLVHLDVFFGVAPSSIAVKSNTM